MNPNRIRAWLGTEDGRDLLFIAKVFGIPLVLLLALLMWAFTELAKNAEQWEAFKIEHACKQVASISGNVFNTTSIDARGNVSIGIGSTPDKTGWLCDDGVTYYR